MLALLRYIKKQVVAEEDADRQVQVLLILNHLRVRTSLDILSHLENALLAFSRRKDDISMDLYDNSPAMILARENTRFAKKRGRKTQNIDAKLKLLEELLTDLDATAYAWYIAVTDILDIVYEHWFVSHHDTHTTNQLLQLAWRMVCDQLDSNKDLISLDLTEAQKEMICSLVILNGTLDPSFTLEAEWERKSTVFLGPFNAYKHLKTDLDELVVIGLALLRALSREQIEFVISMFEKRVATNELDLLSATRYFMFRVITTPKEDRRATARERKTVDYNELENIYRPSLDMYNWSNFGQIYIAKSQLSTKDTGYGVFAKTNFKKNDVITQYCGTYYSELPDELKNTDHTPYLRQFRNVHIDGERNVRKLTSRQVGQIIQDPMNPKYVNSKSMALHAFEVPPQYRDNNCISGRQRPLKQENRTFFFEIATKDIAKGEELYTNYKYDPETYIMFNMRPKEDETLAWPPPADDLNLLRKED